MFRDAGAEHRGTAVDREVIQYLAGHGELGAPMILRPLLEYVTVPSDSGVDLIGFIKIEQRQRGQEHIADFPLRAHLVLPVDSGRRGSGVGHHRPPEQGGIRDTAVFQTLNVRGVNGEIPYRLDNDRTARGCLAFSIMRAGGAIHEAVILLIERRVVDTDDARQPVREWIWSARTRLR